MGLAAQRLRLSRGKRKVAPASSRAQAPYTVVHMVDRLGSGGIAQVVLNVTTALDTTLFEPVVVVTRDAPAMDHLDQLRDRGISVVELGRSSRSDLFAWRHCFAALKRASILHTHGLMCNQWGRLWGAIFRVPVVVSHDHTSADQKPRIVQVIDRQLWRMSDMVLTVSDYDREQSIELEGLPKARVRRIYNGVDSATSGRYNRGLARKRLDIEPDRFVVSMVARLAEQKNHRGGIDAFLSMPEEVLSQSELLVVGDGPLRESLEQYVAKRDRDGRIRLLGQRQDVPEILAATDLLLLPSVWECLPMILLEAMALGTAVVATPVGGVTEVLSGVGWPLASASDTKETTAALCEVFSMTDSEYERRSNDGRERIESYFDIQVTTSALQSLYQSLIDVKR